MGPRTFQAVIAADRHGDEPLAETDITTVNLNTEGPAASVELPFSTPVRLVAGQQVYLTLDLLAGSSVNLQPVVTIYTDVGCADTGCSAIGYGVERESVGHGDSLYDGE